MSTLKLCLLIYFIGFIAAYYLQKLYVSDYGKCSWGWGDVGENLGISVFSWLSAIACILAMLSDIKPSSKPPKWL